MRHWSSWKWFHYYWAFFSYLGAECYRTWRWELFASALIGFFVAVVSGQWKDFQTALIATDLTLGCFIVWHIARVPWLVHHSLHGSKTEQPSAWFGMLGIAAIAALVMGSYKLGMVAWQSKPVADITAHFQSADAGAKSAEIQALQRHVSQLESAPVKIITRTESAPAVEKRCWMSYVVAFTNINYQNKTQDNATSVFLVCNYKVDTPVVIQVEFDRDFMTGNTQFIGAGMMMGGGQVKNGKVVSSTVAMPALLSQQIVFVSVFGNSKGDFPIPLRASIATAQ